MAVEPLKIDKLLAANLAKAKMATSVKPYFYALVLKGGGTSGKLLVDRLKIKEPQILNAKKLTGGSAVVIGTCYFDRKISKLVFETIKPPLPTWAQLVKKLARDEAKLSIEVKFELAKRKLEDIKEPEGEDKDEAGEFEAATPDEDAVKQTQALEAWNNQFDALKARLFEAGKAGKPWAKDLWLKLSEAGAIYRQGKQDQGQKLFMEVQALFQQKQSAAQPTGANGQQAAAGSKPQAGSAPPKGPAEKIGSRPTPMGAEEASWPGFEKRLSALLPAYRAAKGGPNGMRLETLFRTANRFRDNADLPQAMKALAEMESLVRRSTAASSGQAMQQDGAAGTAQGTKAMWEKALAEIEPAFVQGVRARPDDASKLRAVMGFAQGKAEKGEFPGALAALKSLKDLLAKGPAAAAGDKTTTAQAAPPKSAAPPSAPKPPPTTGPRTSPGDNINRRVALTKRLNGLASRIEEGKSGPDGAKIGSLEEAAKRALGANDYDSTTKALDDLQSLLDKQSVAKPAADAAADAAKPTEESKPAAAGPSPSQVRSFVRMMKATRDWYDSYQGVVANLKSLRLIILAEFEGDKRIKYSEEILDKVAADLGKLHDPKLEKLAKQMVEASAADRPAIQHEAEKIVQGLKALLDDQKDLAALENWPTMKLPLHSRLAKSLSALEAQLAG